MKKHKIILCQGIQGSGKSTFARAWALENPEHRVRWNNDDFRTLMGKYWVPEREDLVKLEREHFLLIAMLRGYDIIIDDMNLNPKTIQNYQILVSNWNNDNNLYQYELEFHLFNTPLEICIERDSARPNPIGAKIITETYNRYKKFLESHDKTN